MRSFISLHFLISILYLYIVRRISKFIFFFFNDTATTEIYTLSLHDALPISQPCQDSGHCRERPRDAVRVAEPRGAREVLRRSEEHTSELQSQSNLVCRLLLEKKKTSTTLDMRRLHLYSAV